MPSEKSRIPRAVRRRVRRVWARWLRRLLPSLSAGFFATGSFLVMAGPDSPVVVNGTANVRQDGGNLTLEVSHNAVLQWQRFNIAEGETRTFVQPSVTSIVWNRILDQQPSQILGALRSNGYVVLMNEHGFYFGPKSVINVGGLVATTVPLAPSDCIGGGLWQFSGTPPAASIVHYGEIKANHGGSVYLIAEKVENHGVIMAPDGNIGLYAGKEVLVSERPDGRGVSASVNLPAGSVDNHGRLIADAGSIALNAKVVNQQGLVQANSVRERHGVIELVASDALELGTTSQVIAHGDPAEPSRGGDVTVKSGGAFSDAAGSRIDVSGGSMGGDGGHVEISALSLGGIESQVLGRAALGWHGGEFLIDPTDIVINTTGTGSAGNGTVNPGATPATLRLNVSSAFQGFSQIRLQASQDIQIAASTVWDLNASTGISDEGSQLTLQAGRNILFLNGARIQAAEGWSVRLVAGADFASPESVRAGVGGIYLNGNASGSGSGSGSIEAGRGGIRLVAGKDVIVGSGFIRTTARGDISIHAVSGSVNAGTRADGFQYSRFGYAVSNAGLGGIGTTEGGNVSIEAGTDILSIVPTVGAYGSEAGDVTLVAGQRILGGYLVRNGAGRLTAGSDIGSESSPATLSLISGSWDLHAGRDLFLNEVRNPNGTFNSNRLTTGAKVANQFDYADDASVRLEAVRGVSLLGSSLARVSSNSDMPPVYPPQLEIHAGSGGITLGNDVVLYPSAQGRLNLQTSGGGSLHSTSEVSQDPWDATKTVEKPKFFQIAMSDSGDSSYRTFAAGHASATVHDGDASKAAVVSLDGGIENAFLRLPLQAQIDLGGGARNFAFEGQNLAANNTTSIRIAGDYSIRGGLTTVVLNEEPDFTVLDPLVSLRPDLLARLKYDPATRGLTFQGRMQDGDAKFLIDPLVYVYDAQGLNPVETPAVFTRDIESIRKLFRDSQSVITSGLAGAGLQVGGPGTFEISAHALNLGTSSGIRSIGAQRNPALAPYATAGAALKIDTVAGMDMTSSQIASMAGGGIRIRAGTELNVGSQEQFSSDDTPKGIYTAAGGDVDVQAAGTINVNGSRIAAFDGGDVSVVSTGGDVNAGAGGLGVLVLNRTVVDPVTGEASSVPFHLAISGIAATSFPGSGRVLGNLVIEAAGSIFANFGGVRQAAFGGGVSAAVVRLKAGLDILAGLSGIIGENIRLEAGRNIEGLVVAKSTLNIDSRQNVNVLAVAGGAASVSAGAEISGRIASGTSISVDAASVSGSLISHNVSTGNSDASSAAVGVQSAAPARAEKVAPDAAEAVATAKAGLEEEDEEARRRRAQQPTLARTTGRVTVILPLKPKP